MFSRIVARSAVALKASISIPSRAFAVKAAESVEDLNSIVKDSKNLVVIDWYATWCGPCKIFAPVYSKLSDQFPDATFIKADIDEVDAEAIEGFPSISSVPTFFIVKDGKVVRSFSGANEAQLVDAIKQYK